jgi:hypothetical protein
MCGAKRHQGIDISEKEKYDIELYTEHDCTATVQILIVGMGEKGCVHERHFDMASDDACLRGPCSS